MQVHVITASRHDSTTEIGEVIAARLCELGHDAIAADAESVVGLPAPGDAVVLGSPIYMGKWLAPARELLDRLASEPAGREIFVFSVGPVGHPPKPVGAAPEPEVVAFALERARSQKTFAGRLDRAGLGRFERIAVGAVSAPEGDYRDWPAISAWADKISDGLIAAQAPLDAVTASVYA